MSDEANKEYMVATLNGNPVVMVLERDELVDSLRRQAEELLRQLQALRAGQTVTIEYDLSPAMRESAVRNKLIELGWTPPQA